MKDFFSVEYQIKTRIAEKLPEIKALYSVNDQAIETQVPTPAVVVSFMGDTVSDQANFTAEVFMINQTWAVTLMLPAKYNIAEIGNAGWLLAEITRVLHGWVPEGCASALTRIDAQPVERSDHYLLYQQNFVVSFITEKSEVF